MMPLTPKQIRVTKTTFLYFSSIASGMSMAVTGPTLLDLQNIVRTDTEHIALVYTARSSGYLFGSLAGGALFDATPRKQLLMTIFNLLVSISLFAIPWSGSLEILTGWMIVNGFSLGSLDTGLNVCILNLWGKDSGPYYQALHFVYGFGCLVAPLIVAPFLMRSSEDFEPNIPFLHENNTYPLASNNYNISISTNSSTEIVGIPSIAYGYFILGGFAFIVTVLFIMVCFASPVEDAGNVPAESNIRKRSSTFLFVIVSLAFLLLFVETGTEIGYAQMLTTYAVKSPMRLTTVTGSYMTSAYWATFTVGRFASIFLAIKFDSLTLIVVELAITSAGTIALVFLATTREWALWLSSVLLGFGIASLFPSVVSWTERYITISNKIIGLFATGAAFGEMAIPYTISYFIEEIPQVLGYVVAASCVLSIALTVVLYLILRRVPEKYIDEKGVSNEACENNEIPHINS